MKKKELERFRFLKRYARYIRNGKRYFGIWANELALFDFLEQCNGHN